ncbi:protein FAR1-RELATED SEQUENCE 5-like [Lathyrus oleraceus]|uniref:protein FAR1-RELATED SEQUENCE 5-like n=1 Tax=Pisum sativum TaxID=3888 RepID=UPI0021D1B5F5|nr:protein FAR1-RELATED SEQUENCE 5-like [Pisum sativum]
MDCERGGNYKRKNVSESNNSSGDVYRIKVKCPFRLRSVSIDSGWKVIVWCGLHNHKLYEDLKGHDILGCLKDYERRFVSDMTKYNMTPRYIVTTLKDKDLENLISVTQVYKARTTYNVNKRNTLTEMQMLLSLIHKEKYTCWTRNREDSNIVAGIFWTHSDSVNLLNIFHLVLIFDCTYKTNRYQLPLLEIVGVTSTKLTFSVDFAYFEHERVEKLKKLFSFKNLLQMVVVTDQELALMDAMENNIVYANREIEFVEHLKHFETVCVDIPLFVKYVTEIWLSPYKERLVAA